MILDIVVVIIGAWACLALIATALLASRLVSFEDRVKHDPKTRCPEKDTLGALVALDIARMEKQEVV
jgi:hypothetical protein